MTLTDCDLAYAAGLIDGEGCFSISSMKGRGGRPKFYYLQCHIRVAMTSKETVKWLHETFGGNFNYVKKEGPNRRPQWSWSATGIKAKEVAILLMPFLKLKRPQAELLIECRDYLTECAKKPSGHNLFSAEGELGTRIEYAARMRRLNGHP